MSLTEYTPGAPFPGVIGRTNKESTPAWPRPNRAPDGAPNVLFVVLDDTGFGQLGADTGGSVTPAYEAPFRFSGHLRRVTVDIGGEHVEDYEAQMKIALAKQ